MSISLVHEHLSLFAPPLDMPLGIQLPGGLFGMKRPWGDLTRTYSHTGLDLASSNNSSVYASRSGQVVLIDGPADNQRLFVRHRDQGPPFLATYYLHVKNPLVSVGDWVDEGLPIARVGPIGHLHFEIRQIMETTLPNDWAVSRTEPLDPLPFLYRWDKIYHRNIAGISPSLGRRASLRAVAVRDQDGIWVFEVGHGSVWPIIPLLAPDRGERYLMRLLRDAYMNDKPVRLATRASPFFEGRLIIVGARVVG